MFHSFTLLTVGNVAGMFTSFASLGLSPLQQRWYHQLRRYGRYTNPLLFLESALHFSSKVVIRYRGECLRGQVQNGLRLVSRCRCRRMSTWGRCSGGGTSGPPSVALVVYFFSQSSTFAVSESITARIASTWGSAPRAVPGAREATLPGTAEEYPAPASAGGPHCSL